MPDISGLFVAAHAMDEIVCRRVQDAMDHGVLEPAEVLEDEFALAEHARSAADVDVPADVIALVERCLDRQRAAIEAFFGWPLQSREGTGLVRYEAGGFYRRHVDRADVPSWPAASRRAVTLILFLNSSRELDPAGGFDGGLLRLYTDAEDPVEIAAARGTLIAFASDIPHEVTPVTGGTRDTAVDWLLSG